MAEFNGIEIIDAPVEQVRRVPVVFKNQDSGLMLAGITFYPKDMKAEDKLPAIVLAGPMLAVKELAQSKYAMLLAQKGYATLVFDYTSLGSSEGLPRGQEDPEIKASDIRSAVSFLQTLPNVDPDRIAGIGICGSGVYMPLAAVREDRMKALVSIVPFAIIDQIRTGTDEEILKLKADYENGAEPVRLSLMPKGSEGGNYYYNTDRGAAANMIDPVAWSQLGWQKFHPTEVVKGLKQPYLIITSENAFTRDGAKAMYENARSAVKKYFEVEKAGHFDMYDLKPYVEQNITKIQEFLQANL